MLRLGLNNSFEADRPAAAEGKFMRDYQALSKSFATKPLMQR